MISTDSILKMVSERYHQDKENRDDSSNLSKLFPSLYSDHPKVTNELGLTRKEQLLQVPAIVASELKSIEHDREAALCFLKYLP